MSDTFDRYDRGVSDLVAFTLVFSIIISSIGLVTLGGFEALEGVRDGAETNTAESTMVGYAETLSDHKDERAPRRETTIKLQGHSLSRQASTFEVSVTNASGTRTTTVAAGTLIRTTSTGTELAYTSGAVFRVQEDGGLRVVRSPPLRCGGADAHLSFLRVDGNLNESSSGRLTLRSTLENRSLFYPRSSASASATSVTIDVSGTHYQEAWERTFERHLGWSQVGTGQYECTGIGRAVVENSTVGIQAIS